MVGRPAKNAKVALVVSLVMSSAQRDYTRDEQRPGFPEIASVLIACVGHEALDRVDARGCGDDEYFGAERFAEVDVQIGLAHAHVKGQDPAFALGELHCNHPLQGLHAWAPKWDDNVRSENELAVERFAPSSGVCPAP